MYYIYAFTVFIYTKELPPEGFIFFLTVVFYLTEIYVKLLLPCLLILHCTVPVRPSRYLPVNKFTFLL